MRRRAAISRFEPKNEPVPKYQRAFGRIDASFNLVGASTRLSSLHQSGSAKLRLPKTYAAHCEAILINTAGGITGGDRFATALRAGSGSEVVVTTQACERAYRSIGGGARVATEIIVDEGARLDWLPQETILFDRSRLERRFEVELAESATFLAVETIILGRVAMGETVRHGCFHDRWRIRRGGRLVFADDIRLDGAMDEIARHPAAFAGHKAIATIIEIGPDGERHVDAVRSVLGDRGGASAFGEKTIARMTAPNGHELKQRLIEVLRILRNSPAIPRAWLQ